MFIFYINILFLLTGYSQYEKGDKNINLKIK